MDFFARLDALRERWNVLEHPFYQRGSAGELSRDEFALSYSNFAYGREVYAARGYPPVDDPSLNPDRHVLSLSATFWW